MVVVDMEDKVAVKVDKPVMGMEEELIQNQ
jgi:hypothetical protein